MEQRNTKEWIFEDSKKFLTNNRHYYWCIMGICNVDKKWKDIVSYGEWVHNAQQMFYTGQYDKFYLKKSSTIVITRIQLFWKAADNTRQVLQQV